MILFRMFRPSKAKGLLALVLAASLAPLSTLAKEPFSAVAKFDEVLGPSTDPQCQPTKNEPGLTAMGTISGNGLATEIGAFAVASTDCVRSTNPYAFTPPFTFSSTSFVLTAKNGDQVIVSYSGTAEPSPSGLLVLSGEFKILRGTGQFKKVKGNGTLTGVENIAASPAIGFVVLTGQISD